MVLKINTGQLSHIFQVEKRVIEDSCIVFNMVETSFDGTLVLDKLLVKIFVVFDYLSQFNVLVRFLTLNFTLPELLELRQMQKLEMLITHFSKCAHYDVFQLLKKGWLLWTKQ